MTIGFAIRTLFEIAAVLLLAYGYLHEDKVVAFEKRLKAKYFGHDPKNTPENRQARPAQRQKAPVQTAAPRRVSAVSRPTVYAARTNRIPEVRETRNHAA